MGEVDFRLTDIDTGRNTSPFLSAETGSPVAVVSSDFSATISQDVKKGKAVKKQGDKKKQINPAIDFGTPFFIHYRQWYSSYYGEELKTPRFNKQDLNLETLWNSVKTRGGSQATTSNKKWAEIGRQFNPPKSMTNVSYHIKRLYEKYLLAYEKSVSPHTAMEWRRPQGVNKTSPSTLKVEHDLNIEKCEPAQNVCERAQTQSQEKNANPFEFLRGDEQLVGTVIRLWTNRKDYQVVKVVSFDPKTKAHTIRFSNGVLNAVFLNQHTWSVCPEDLDNRQNKSNAIKQEQQEQDQEEEQDLDLQFLTPVDTTPALPTQQTLNLLQSTYNLTSTGLNLNQHSALQTIEDNEEQLSAIQTLSLQPNNNNNINNMSFMEVAQSSNRNYTTLVSALQIQLEKANQRIEHLEAQDRARKQEQETMRLQFAVREQQLQLIIDQMTIKLREANESRQLAEGAATELRKCFEMLLNGPNNANNSVSFNNNIRAITGNSSNLLGGGFSSPLSGISHLTQM